MRPYDYGMPPDLLGAGLGTTEDDPNSLTNTLKSMRGNMPNMALMQMMASMPQQQPDPYVNSLVTGAQWATGRPVTPLAPQGGMGMGGIQPIQMLKLMMDDQIEQRRLVMDEWKMKQDIDRQDRQARTDQMKAEHDRITAENAREKQKMEKGKEYFTIAKEVADLAGKTNDPVLRKMWADNINAGYKAMGEESTLPKDYILATVNKELTPALENTIWKFATPDPVTKQVTTTPEEAASITGIALPVVKNMYDIATRPALAGRFYNPSEVTKQNADAEAAVGNAFAQRHGIKEAAAMDGTISQLKAFGISDWTKATDDQVAKAKTLWELKEQTKKARELRERTDENVRQYKLEEAIRDGRPLKPDDVTKAMEPFSKMRVQMDTVGKLREWLDKLPADFFPTGQDWISIKAAAARQEAYYKANPEWRDFKGIFNEFSVGYARGPLDDKVRAIKSFEGTLSLVDAGNVPQKRAFVEMIDYYTSTLENMGNSAFKNLMIGKQYPDLIARAVDETGKYLDPTLIKQIANPKSPSNQLSPPTPMGDVRPPAIGNKGRRITNPATGQREISDGEKWVPLIGIERIGE